MNNLMKQDLTLDSREVAKMVEKNHAHLLRDIETYKEYLGESKIGFTDFFIPSTYVSGQNKELPNYQISKKGCEFIAHKLTGQKGTLFTATYINKFHEMEQALVEGEKIQAIPDTKEREVEARLKNANTRQAKLLMQIADRVEITEYKQILNSYAIEIITGEKLIPLPELNQKTFTATEIGQALGISANMVGRLTNEHNLKTSEFGKWFYDKAKYSNKQVESFRYYDNVIPILKKLN